MTRSISAIFALPLSRDTLPLGKPEGKETTVGSDLPRPISPYTQDYLRRQRRRWRWQAIMWTVIVLVVFVAAFLLIAQLLSGLWNDTAVLLPEHHHVGI
jgi:hypothetical protein